MKNFSLCTHKRGGKEEGAKSLLRMHEREREAKSKEKSSLHCTHEMKTVAGRRRIARERKARMRERQRQRKYAM